MADINTLLRLTQEKGASDLHLTAGKPPVLRIDGNLTLTDKEVLKQVYCLKPLEAHKVPLRTKLLLWAIRHKKGLWLASWMLRHLRIGRVKTPYGDEYTGFKISFKW